jgi:hypothetical protein
MKVLAFDIGIRNLAWCLAEKTSEGTWHISGWENYDLLAGTTTQDAKTAAKVLCAAANCNKKATHQKGQEAPTCAKHAPATHPPLKDASGVLLKTLPKLDTLRTLLGPQPKKPKTKADVLEALAAKWSLPFVAPKATRALKEDLVRLHDSMRTFVKAKRELFLGATHILLENQPAFKNPTMKSVQILLFATLRDILDRPDQEVSFVHAGKKVKGATKGDAGYAARKKGGEERVKEFFEKEKVADKERWLEYFKGQQKTSDLCDALCMCVDKISAAPA